MAEIGRLLEFDSHRTTAEEHTMTETRTPAQPDPTRRLQVKRRAKRGIVASYIHQLSERHSENAVREDLPVEAAIEENAVREDLPAEAVIERAEEQAA
jgi:hypothetical protein